MLLSGFYWPKSKELTTKSVIFWSKDMAWVPLSVQVCVFSPVFGKNQVKNIITHLSKHKKHCMTS